MRYLTIISTLALVACFAVTAKAEVDNVKVGGDVQVRFIERGDFDLNDNVTATNAIDSGSWFDSTTRVQIDAELSDDVAACIRFLNERDWDAADETEAGGQDDVELDLANISLGNMWGYPLAATFGRQEILFGEGFLIGDGYNTVSTQDLNYGKSVRRAFDAVRLTYSAEPYTVDLFSAEIDDDSANTVNTWVGDESLYGININRSAGNVTVDLGYFVNDDEEANTQTNALSLRVEGRPQTHPGLTLKAEYVDESGNANSRGLNSRGTEDLDANAWYLGANYDLQNNPYSAYFGLTWFFMSGDEDNVIGPVFGPSATDDEQFDPLYEDMVFGEINEAAGFSMANTNLKGWKLGAGLKPREALSLDIAYYIMDRDEAGKNAVTGGTIDDDYGDELDIYLTYDYTEDVQFGLCAAWFSPGGWFDDADNAAAPLGYGYGTGYDDKATQIVGSVKVSF